MEATKMNTTYYLATTYWVIGVNIIFLFATLWLLRTGRATRATKTTFGLISIGWIALFHFVFSNQLFLPIDISGGSFYALTLTSAALVLGFFYLSPLKKVFDTVPQENIQLVQGLRVFVACGFLMEGVLNVIPGWFSIMDGFLHVFSGFLALLAAIAVVKNERSQNMFLWLANMVGVLDIVIIVTSINLFVWEELGAFHNMQYVVFYTGVLLLWFHFVSISKLLKSNQ